MNKQLKIEKRDPVTYWPTAFWIASIWLSLGWMVSSIASCMAK